MRLLGNSLPFLLSTVAALGCGGSPPVGPRTAAPEEDPGAVSGEQPPPLADDHEQWELCGPSVRLVKDIYPGSAGSVPEELAHGDNLLFFSADDGATGQEPWTSTGSRAGTLRLKDVCPGTLGSVPEQFTRLGGTVFFTADDCMHGRELWKTDGTEAGTVMVADLYPGGLSAEPEHLTVFQGVLYFTAEDGVHGRELWRTDGTAAGTYLLRDFTPVGDFLSTQFALAATKKHLYVRVGLYSPTDIEGSRTQLWRTDGTAAGFTDVLNAAEDTTISELTPFGDRLFFLFNTDEPETSLYITGGTSPGVRFVHEFIYDPRELTVLDGTLYFAAGTQTDDSGVLDEELWRSDGTPSGTWRVKDVWPGLTASEPAGLTAVGKYLFFSAEDGTHGRELWRSDGTEGGTVLSDDLEPGLAGSSPEELTSIEGHLFFSASTVGAGREAWVTEGGLGGAEPLDEVAPGPVSSMPLEFMRSGWDVYFAADDAGRHGRELRAVRFRPKGKCP